MPRLGLIDDSPSRWADLKDKIARLNKDAPAGTAYKLAFVQRHGEGWHNVAEAFYGSPVSVVALFQKVEEIADSFLGVLA